MAQNGKTDNYDIPYVLPADTFVPAEVGDSFTVVDTVLTEFNTNIGDANSVAGEAKQLAITAAASATEALDTANSAATTASQAITTANTANENASTALQNTNTLKVQVDKNTSDIANAGTWVNGAFTNPNPSVFVNYNLLYNYNKALGIFNVFGTVSSTENITNSTVLADYSSISTLPKPAAGAGAFIVNYSGGYTTMRTPIANQPTTLANGIQIGTAADIHPQFAAGDNPLDKNTINLNAIYMNTNNASRWVVPTL